MFFQQNRRTIKKTDLPIFLYIIPLFISVFFFDGVIVSISGFFLIFIASFRWGLPGGLLSAMVCSFLVLLLFVLSPYDIVLYRVLATILLNLLLGLSLGRGIELLQTKEAESYETHRKFKDLVEQSSDWIWEMDATYTYTFTNSNVEELLGYKPEEMLGKTPLDFMTSYEGILLKKRMKELSVERPSLLMKNVFTHEEGHPVFFETSIVLVQNEKSSMVGLRGIGRDISHRIKMEESLKKNEEKYRTLYETMVQGIIYHSQDGEILSANPAAEDILGITYDYLVGCSLLCPYWRFKKEDGTPLPPKEHPYAVALKTGKEVGKYVMGLFHPRREEDIWVEVSAVPQYREGEKRPYQVYSILEDITHRKRAEERIQEYLKEIEIQNMELESLYEFLDSEIEKAMHIHERTLPNSFPQEEGLFFAAHYKPAERMGGDFYNVIKKGRKIITYISDVSGQGMVGALLSSFVKDMINCFIRFVPEEEITPSNIIEFLHEEYSKEDFPADYFICIYIGTLDLDTLELQYLGAGFQDDPLLSINREAILPLKNSGLPISSVFTLEMLNLRERTIQLHPTSTLLFNTDGLTEQLVGRDPYGKRLHGIFRENCHDSPHRIVERINQDFKEFNHGSLQGDDDITLLILQVIKNEE